MGGELTGETYLQGHEPTAIPGARSREPGIDLPLYENLGDSQAIGGVCAFQGGRPLSVDSSHPIGYRAPGTPYEFRHLFEPRFERKLSHHLGEAPLRGQISQVGHSRRLGTPFTQSPCSVLSQPGVPLGERSGQHRSGFRRFDSSKRKSCQIRSEWVRTMLLD